MAEAAGRRAPPWEVPVQQQQEPLLLNDDGVPVDVTHFVRFELNHGDIRYGVLDLIVQLSYKGNRAQCYLLHFFPVDAVKQNVRPTFPEWTEGFNVPPALLKLTVTLEGSTIQLFNTRGATVYDSKRTLVRRMIMHVQYHEEPLLTLLESEHTVPAREATQDMDPLDAFLQMRPFQGSLPRRAGFWTTHNRLQQSPLRVEAQSVEQELPQREVERTHHQVETALHARVQALHALIEDVEQTVDHMPPDVQGTLLAPLADLHYNCAG